MIGAPSLEQSFPKDSPRVPTSTKKQRFPLGAYNQLKRERLQAELEKKLETDIKINQVKAGIIEKEAELQRRNEELHNIEEKLRRKKRKIADLKTDLEDNSAEMKKIKRPTLSSVLDKTSSDKLNLSRHQFRRRRRKTLNALRPIHCSPFSVKDNKPIYAGMWTTLVSDVSKKDLTTYVEKSTRCTEEHT